MGKGKRRGQAPPEETEYDSPLDVVAVTTRDGQLLRGALAVRLADGGMVLRTARLATVGQNRRVGWTPLDYEVVIPAANVAYWQRGLDASVLAET